MKLVISSRFGMSVLDLDSGEITDPFNIPETWSPYGISWDQDKMFIALRPGGKLSLERLWVYDRNLSKTGEIVKDKMTFSDLHQVFCFDGRVWVCSPGRNQVAIIDPDGSHEVWKPNPDKETVKREGRPPLDYNHFNSVWIKDDRLYLVAHNFERRAEVWEFTYPGRELIKKLPLNDYAHNICVTKKDFITLGSEDNKHYGRGLAVSEEFVFRGDSRYIKDKIERQKSLQGSVVVEDREFNKIREIPINKGEIYEIRILDRPDHAHNGIIWE